MDVMMPEIFAITFARSYAGDSRAHAPHSACPISRHFASALRIPSRCTKESQTFDPARGLTFADRPYVIMNDHAMVDLGTYRQARPAAVG